MKRLLAIVLAAALALVIAVSPAAAGPALYGDSGRWGHINLAEFSTLLDVSDQEEGGQYYRSYAFAEVGKDALTWKEIRSADLTIGLEWDLSGLLKKPGRLILSSSDADGNPALSVNDCIDTVADEAVGYAMYTITGAAFNPSAIGAEKIIYNDTGAYIDIGAGNEWSKDGYTWTPASDDGPRGTDTAEKWCVLPISTARQTVYVRGQAAADTEGNITLPSLKSVKVTVPAMPKAPKVRIYPSEALLSAKAGLEISNDGETWAKMTENTLPLGAVTILPASVAGDGHIPIDLSDKQDVYVRVPAGGGKPHSDTFETHIRISNTGPVSESDFTAAPKQTILADDSVVIEVFIGGKWKKVKKFTADDIPEAGLTVRRAGTRERLPGPERILRLVSDGGYRTISVTEP